MAVTTCYSTAEPHVDAVCDISVQKIGPHYRVYLYDTLLFFFFSSSWAVILGDLALSVNMFVHFGYWHYIDFIVYLIVNLMPFVIILIKLLCMYVCMYVCMYK